MKIKDLSGRALPVVTLDFETYWQQGKGDEFNYTLSKMTTTSYVRDPRFKAHGAAVRLPEWDKAQWVTHDDLPAFFAAIDWANTALLCQHTAFDGFILSQIYGHVPAYYLDTKSMSVGEWGVHVPHSLGQIGDRLGLGGKIEGELVKSANLRDLPPEIEQGLIPYALRDADLTYEVFEKLYYEHNYPENELHIIDLTIRAFAAPVLQVDHQMCREEAEREAESKVRLTGLAGVESMKQIASNPQFAALLEARGVEVPLKISPVTGKETFAFSKADLDFRKLADDPRCSDLYRARMAVKSTIYETRAHRLIAHSDPALPVPLTYCGAHTHRWTAWDKVNLQNLPSDRKGQSDALRRSIHAPDGYVLGVVDSKQIEARVLAWCAGQQELLEAFATGRDPYRDMGCAVFNCEPEFLPPHGRQLGKTLVLGAGYGMGGPKFAYTCKSGSLGPPIDISENLAYQAIAAYRNKYSEIPLLWRQLEVCLARMAQGGTFSFGPWQFHGDRVLMPNSLFLYYPNLTETESGFNYLFRNDPRSIYGGAFTENLVQSTARTIVAQQALNVAKRYRVVLLVHDEVVYLIPENEAEEGVRYGIDCLSEPPTWCEGLPIGADGGYAKHYAKPK